ncbi:MAG: hypothetical protein A2283_05400 [Lentisphaerae bacterium RIFOXYA12_FULL_48_11]|nr:MAG: hypothetical protein A2283_05400 [Lentisphaerae bacterium RIFOXYA12_FULL_48_11]
MFAVMLFQSAAFAQYDTDFRNPNKLPDTDEKKRKTPSFFHRPSKETAASQIEFADKLLAEGKQKAAMKQYSALVHKWHTSPEASKAQLAYARILYDRNDYRDAFDEFQYLIDNFSGQFSYEEALDKQFRIANYLMTARRMKFLFMPGFKIQEQALPLFEMIVKNAPNWKNSIEAQYNIGLISEDMGDYLEAIRAFDAVRYRYPDSDRAADASFRRAYCYYLMANESIRDEISCRQALSALAGFIADYPKYADLELALKYRDELDDRLANMYLERAEFYDKTGRKKAAVIAYEDFVRKFPSSRLAGDISMRIETLKRELEKNK